jgi:hypothetical protein
MRIENDALLLALMAASCFLGGAAGIALGVWVLL